MNQGRRLAWGSVALLVLVGVGGAVLGARTGSTPLSASAQLTAAMSATDHASGYVEIANHDPKEESIFNRPNLVEIISGGRVSAIWDGKTVYTAVPGSCGGSVRFIRVQPQGSATSKFVGFGRNTVSQNGATFIVRSTGGRSGRFLVHHGHVVQITENVPALQGSGGTTFTESFTSIGHAPRITVPAPSEVTTSPRLYFHDCPL
jgi:hypothetical protein